MHHQILQQNKEAILTEWFKRAVGQYKPDTARFLAKEQDPFANPMGGVLQSGFKAIIDDMIAEKPLDEFTPHLESILKVKAVQEFSPADSVSFLFILKQILQEHYQETSLKEWFELDHILDDLINSSFNIYTQNREKIFEIRLQQIKLAGRDPGKVPGQSRLLRKTKQQTSS